MPLNRIATGILTLTREASTVRSMLCRCGWVNNNLNRCKSSPQLKLYAPTVVVVIPITLGLSLIRDASNSNAFVLHVAPRAVFAAPAIDIEIFGNAADAYRNWVCLVKTRLSATVAFIIIGPSAHPRPLDILY